MDEESRMLCKELIPTDPRDPTPLELTSELRAVGSVVRAMCANKTVAILECKPNLLWNGTLPSCDESDEEMRNLSSILIIVWVIGGVLLFTLIILIAIIIGSRSKPVRRVNGQPPSEVFHISGQGEGGDNPAFSRSEERCGSSTRLTSPNSNTRLPSYQEAIRGLYSGRPSPSAPSTSAVSEPYFVRANAPPSYRSSHLYRAADVHTPATQTTTATSVNETAPTTRESSSSRRQRPTAGQSSRSSSFPRPPTPGVTRSATANNNNASSSASTQQQVSTRYAESYPQCLWDEDPPPPYTPGPNNIHLYRSPSRTSPSRMAIRRSLPSRSRPTPPVTPAPSSTSQPQSPNPPSTSDNGSRIPAPPTTNSSNNQMSSHHHHQQHHQQQQHPQNPNGNNVSTVASVEHPLITYSTPCPGTTANPSGHFSTIHLTNTIDNRLIESQRNFNSLPFAPIQPVNQNYSSLHSMMPASNNPLLGPPLSSSTPVPVRRDVNINHPTTVTHVPLPPPTHHQQHSRSQSHGNDPRGHNQNNIPVPHRPLPLPRPRPQTNVHHDRQQSAPLARLEVEYF